MDKTLRDMLLTHRPLQHPETDKALLYTVTGFATRDDSGEIHAAPDRSVCGGCAQRMSGIKALRIVHIRPTGYPDRCEMCGCWMCDHDTLMAHLDEIRPQPSTGFGVLGSPFTVHFSPQS